MSIQDFYFFEKFYSRTFLTVAFVVLYSTVKKQKKKFRWKSTHDVWLLTETISIEPYKWKYGSRERGEAFTTIAQNLRQIPNSGFPDSLGQRSVRTRFFELVDVFKKQEVREAKASGIHVEFDEKTKLLTDIVSRIDDYEKGFVQEKQVKQDKKDKEKLTAEDMRQTACERLGETSKRQEQNPLPRKRKSTEFMEYLKYKHDANKQTTEKQLKIREEELKIEKQKLDVQEGIQKQMLEQLKLQRESQQAMFTFFQTFMQKK